MDELVERAFQAVQTLPSEDRERIAYEILERVENKTEWDRLVQEPLAQDWLEKASRKALKMYTKSAKRLSMNYVNVTINNLLREGSYWKSFDELPEEVRNLAESNYQSWKQNSKNPGLRFKKIHNAFPVFSFRVGMNHRTVGAEAQDGKMIWFWVGSFQDFKNEIGLV